MPSLNPGASELTGIAAANSFDCPAVAGEVSAILAAAPRCDCLTSMNVYAENVDAALRRVAPSVRLTLLRPGNENDTWGRKQWLRYFDYPRLAHRELKRQRNSVLHVLDHSSAHLCRIAAKSVVTCHDVADLRMSVMKRWQFLLWKWRIHGLHRASKIVAVSQNTSRDLQSLLGIHPDRITVIPNGVSPHFGPASQPTRSAPGMQVAMLRESKFVFLHVGTNIPRKNIPTLLRALSVVRKSFPETRLVKVGKSFASDGYAELLQELGLVEDIVDLGRISDDALAEVYRNAHCLLLPSIYEGFGLPVLEAQASGLPCILAQSSSLEEVGGAAALYHDPKSAEDLARKMIEMLRHEQLRLLISRQGVSNAAGFTWDNHARRLVEIYREVAADSPYGTPHARRGPSLE